MRGCVLVALFATRAAVAQPGGSADAALASCKARRHAIENEAAAIRDADARGRLLSSMPSCHRRDDGSVEVVEAPLAPVEDTSPFTPHFEIGVTAGVAAIAMMDGASGTAAGLGAVVELGGEWRFRRHLAVAAYSSYTSFEDPAYMVALGSFNGQGIYAVYDVREKIFDAGGSLHAVYEPFSFGGGLGVAVERGKAYAAYSDYSNVLVEARGEGAIRVARTGSVAIDVVAIATAATPPSGRDRQLVSARFGLGLRF